MGYVIVYVMFIVIVGISKNKILKRINKDERI